MTERDNGQTAETDGAISENAVVMRRCPFRTGAWQCRMWRQAKERHAMCDIHRRALLAGVHDLPGMLAIMVIEREIERKAKRLDDALSIDDLKRYRLAMLEDGCSSEEALMKVANYPFHWRPIAECWHLLTGQPLPECFVPTPDTHVEAPALPPDHGGAP